MASLFLPKASTCKRYGLSLDDWEDMAARQGYACAVCGQEPKNGRLVIDHVHVKGWRKMPPQERKRYVRGLLDLRCNWQYVRRGMTTAIANGVARYLARYDATANNRPSPTK